MRPGGGRNFFAVGEVNLSVMPVVGLVANSESTDVFADLLNDTDTLVSSTQWIRPKRNLVANQRKLGSDAHASVQCANQNIFRSLLWQDNVGIAEILVFVTE